MVTIKRKSRFTKYADHNRKFGLHNKKKKRKFKYNAEKQDGVFDRWLQ